MLQAVVTANAARQRALSFHDRARPLSWERTSHKLSPIVSTIFLSRRAPHRAPERHHGHAALELLNGLGAAPRACHNAAPSRRVRPGVREGWHQSGHLLVVAPPPPPLLGGGRPPRARRPPGLRRASRARGNAIAPATRPRRGPRKATRARGTRTPCRSRRGLARRPTSLQQLRQGSMETPDPLVGVAEDPRVAVEVVAEKVELAFRTDMVAQGEATTL